MISNHKGGAARLGDAASIPDDGGPGPERSTAATRPSAPEHRDHAAAETDIVKETDAPRAADERRLSEAAIAGGVPQPQRALVD